MAFKPIQPPQENQLVFVNVNATAVAIGELLINNVGSTAFGKAIGGEGVVEAWHRKCVAAEANTAGTNNQGLKCILVQPGVVWEATTTNNSNTTHDGDRMVLTSGTEVNNTGTDSSAVGAVFIQHHPIGAASDKKVIGEIVFGNGIDPDAT